MKLLFMEINFNEEHDFNGNYFSCKLLVTDKKICLKRASSENHQLAKIETTCE